MARLDRGQGSRIMRSKMRPARRSTRPRTWPASDRIAAALLSFFFCLHLFAFCQRLACSVLRCDRRMASEVSERRGDCQPPGRWGSNWSSRPAVAAAQTASWSLWRLRPMQTRPWTISFCKPQETQAHCRESVGPHAGKAATSKRERSAAECARCRPQRRPAAAAVLLLLCCCCLCAAFASDSAEMGECCEGVHCVFSLRPPPLSLHFPLHAARPSGPSPRSPDPLINERLQSAPSAAASSGPGQSPHPPPI